MTVDRDAELDAVVEANVADWPSLTSERRTELRRLLLPAADRVRARLTQTADEPLSPRGSTRARRPSKSA